MVAAKTFKISRLGINTVAFAQRFHRDRHPVVALMDKNKSYFGDSERLTAAELIEIESWPNTVSELFKHKESAEAKDHFLCCIRNATEPETSTEKIVFKLIHQALAMGGLHCRPELIDVNEYTQFTKILRDPPSNDVVDLKALPLRSFLLGLQRAMAKEWEDATWETHIYYECKAYEAAHEAYEEMNEAYEEMQEGAAEIYNEIYSDMENYADSDEEGWFYGDED